MFPRMAENLHDTALKMLSPINMPTGSTRILVQKTMGLNELKTLGIFYSAQKKIDGKVFAPIFDNDKLLAFS